MPLIARVVPFLASAGVSSGSFNVTHPDLTSPDCGVLFGSGAPTNDGVRATHGFFAMGLFNSLAQQGAVGTNYQGQQGTTQTRRVMNASHVATYSGLNNTSQEGLLEVTALVPGGVELTYRDEFTRDVWMSLLLFEGALNCDVNQRVNFRTGEVNLGWPPDLLIGIGTTGDNSIATFGKGFIGFCCRRPAGFEQASVGWDSADNAAAVGHWQSIKPDVFALRHSTDQLYEQYSVADMSATGYTFGNASQSMTDQRVLAIQLPAGQQARCGLFAVQDALGAQTIPVTYDAAPTDTEAAVVACWGLDVETLGEDTENKDSTSVGVVDSTLSQHSMAYCDDAGNTTTQAESLFRNGGLIDNVKGGTGTAHKVASCTSLANGIALDVTATDAAVNQALWFAIQGTGAAPGDDAEVGLPREALTLTARAPSVVVPEDVDATLPREQLLLRGRTPTTTIPGGEDITLPRGPLDLIPRAPGTRTSELVDSTLPREQLTLTARAPGVVAEAEANVQLGRVPLTLTARAPLVVSGADAVISLPRLPLDLTPRAPEISADDDEVSTLPAARLLSRASAPLIYLAGDKNTALPSARLKASAMFVRVRTTEPSEDDDPSGGIASRPASEVYSTPASPRIG